MSLRLFIVEDNIIIITEQLIRVCPFLGPPIIISYP